MNLFKRLEGIFFNPRPVFDGLAAKPVWVDALVVILLALIAFNLVVAPFMQRDQLQLMKDNTALKERLGADRYTQMIQNIEHPPPGAGSSRPSSPRLSSISPRSSCRA